MDVHCRKCWLIYQAQKGDNDGDLYVTAQCPQCSTKCNVCMICNKCYFHSQHKNDYRNIRNHITKCHPHNRTTEEPIPNQECHQDEDEDVQPQSPSDAYFPSNDDGIDVDIAENHGYEQILQENTIIELHSFDRFSNEKSNQYFWQEYICNQHGEAFGGGRGIVWRSMFRLRIYDHTKITDLRDSRMLFNMTQYVMSNTTEQTSHSWINCKI